MSNALSDRIKSELAAVKRQRDEHVSGAAEGLHESSPDTIARYEHDIRRLEREIAVVSKDVSTIGEAEYRAHQKAFLAAAGDNSPTGRRRS